MAGPRPQVRREQPPPDPTRRPAHARARATVDLFSAGTLARQVVFSKGNLDPATLHTLEVRNLGTAGRSRVDVDAFVVLR